MSQILELVGFCLVAIIFILWSNKRLKSGKDFRPPLIAGIIIYGVGIIGARAQGSSITGSIIAIILLLVAFIVFSGKVKR